MPNETNSLDEYRTIDEADEVAIERAKMAKSNALFLDALDPSRSEARIQSQKDKEADRRVKFLERQRKMKEMVRFDVVAKKNLCGLGFVSREIVERAAFESGIEASQIIGPSRKRNVVHARFLAIRLLRDLKNKDGSHRFSCVEIGRKLGGRDHSSILHAEKQFDIYYKAYPKLAAAYDRINNVQ